MRNLIPLLLCAPLYDVVPCRTADNYSTLERLNHAGLLSCASPGVTIHVEHVMTCLGIQFTVRSRRVVPPEVVRCED